MTDLDLSRQPGLDRSWLALGLIIFLLLGGCQAKEPPLSPGAAAFKKEIKDCIDRVAGPLIEPVLRKDVPAIKQNLSRIEPQAAKLCRMCPFQIGVLDREGDTLALCPEKGGSMANFTSYSLVARVLRKRKAIQQRFFLQDGSEIYIIAVPLMQKTDLGSDLVGILFMSLGADEAKSRWGLTEKEFLALDFNKK